MPLVGFFSATFLRLLERYAFPYRNRKNVVYLCALSNICPWGLNEYFLPHVYLSNRAILGAGVLFEKEAKKRE
jgi:hypothetical protein